MSPDTGLGDARLPQGHDDDAKDMTTQHNLIEVSQKKKNITRIRKMT